MGRQTRQAPGAAPNRPLALSAECWTNGVAAAFLAARPRGFCRLLDDDLDQDPRRMIALWPWWDERPALFVIRLERATADEFRLRLWIRALALAAEQRAAVLEIALPAVAEAAASLTRDPSFEPAPATRARSDGLWRRFKRARPEDRPYARFVRLPQELRRDPPHGPAELMQFLQ